MYGGRRRPRKVVLVIQKQRGGGVRLIQRRNLAQNAGLGGGQRRTRRRDAAAALLVVKAVDLGAAQAQQFGQAVGRIAQAAEVALVHHAAPLADHHRPPAAGKAAELFGKIFPQQVEHRRHHQAVPGQVAALAHKVHRDAGAGQGVIVAGQFPPVSQPQVARPAGAFQRPHIRPVVDDGRLPGAPGAGCAGQLFQRRAHLRRLPEGPRIAAAVMPDDRPVELFLGAAAGTPLEIADAVRPVGHRLQGRQHGHARLFLLGHRLPVGKAGAGFHEQKGLALERIEQVVHHGGVQRGLLHRFAGLVPGGVVVPADQVQLFGQVMVVDIVEAVHQVGGKLCFRQDAADHVPLKSEKVNVPVADEPLPVKRQPLHRVLALGGGAFDLVPIGIIMAPEPGVPGFVQGFQAAVAGLQPAAEFRLAERAVAVAAHLVGDVPEDHRRVAAKAAGQLLVDGAHLLPEQGRGVAVVLAAAEQFPGAVGPHPAHIGVSLRHPGRARRAGGGQNGRDAVGIQGVDDRFQPVEVVFPFPRLHHRPGKHPQRHHVHMGLFHHRDVLFQDIRPVQPLFRVVIPAV